MTEELETIFRMLREGTVNSEEAGKLLKAIGVPNVDQPETQSIMSRAADGTITPAQAAQELQAQTAPEAVPPNPTVGTGKWFRVRVDQPGKKPVNIRMPLGLVDAGLRLFGGTPIKVDGVPLDAQQLWQAVRSSNVGKIIEIDGDGGEHVELSVE